MPLSPSSIRAHSLGRSLFLTWRKLNTAPDSISLSSWQTHVPCTGSRGQNRSSTQLNGLMTGRERKFQKWGNSKENTYQTSLGELSGSHHDNANNAKIKIWIIIKSCYSNKMYFQQIHVPSAGRSNAQRTLKEAFSLTKLHFVKLKHLLLRYLMFDLYFANIFGSCEVLPQTKHEPLSHLVWLKLKTKVLWSAE